MKRNQPLLLLVTVAILVIAFSSFIKDDKKRFPGYTPLENGSYFKLHIKGAGTITVDTGGAVFIKIKFKTISDSVFLDINEETKSPSYPMRVDKFEYKGDFLDIFTGLHAGDSASFFMRLDSLQAHYPEEFKFEERYDTMEYLGFVVKVDSIYSREKVKEIRKAVELEQKKQEFQIDSMMVAEPAAIEKYIADNKIKKKPTPNGLYYIETKKGKGENIKDGQTVSIKYTGKFLNGEVFDSSENSGQPLKFVVGQHMVIPGMEEGLLLMKKGGKATFIIPSSLAYRDGGGRMKPYATLVFDIEVVEVSDAK